MLNPIAQDARNQFVRIFLAIITDDNVWHWNILWSEETHSIIYGTVNSHNCHIWGTATPNVIHEQLLHPDYIIVCCGFTINFILRNVFFKSLKF